MQKKKKFKKKALIKEKLIVWSSICFNFALRSQKFHNTPRHCLQSRWRSCVLPYLGAFLTHCAKGCVQHRACVWLYSLGVCLCGSCGSKPFWLWPLFWRGATRRSRRRRRGRRRKSLVRRWTSRCWHADRGNPTYDGRCRNDLHPATTTPAAKKLCNFYFLCMFWLWLHSSWDKHMKGKFWRCSLRGCEVVLKGFGHCSWKWMNWKSDCEVDFITEHQSFTSLEKEKDISHWLCKIWTELRGLKSEANAELPWTCILPNVQQGVIPLVSKMCLTVCKLMRNWPYFSLDFFYISLLLISLIVIYGPILNNNDDIQLGYRVTDKLSMAKTKKATRIIANSGLQKWWTLNPFMHGVNQNIFWKAFLNHFSCSTMSQ